MKYSIENLIDDTEIKEVLYVLEDVEQSILTKENGLEKIENIRVSKQNHHDNTPHEIIYTLVNDYKNDVLDMQTLKEEIFNLLEESKMLKRAR
jgi:hypothetical protein